MSPTDTPNPPARHVSDLIHGFWATQAISTAVGASDFRVLEAVSA